MFLVCLCVFVYISSKEMYYYSIAFTALLHNDIWLYIIIQTVVFSIKSDTFSFDLTLLVIICLRNEKFNMIYFRLHNIGLIINHCIFTKKFFDVFLEFSLLVLFFKLLFLFSLLTHFFISISLFLILFSVTFFLSFSQYVSAYSPL